MVTNAIGMTITPLIAIIWVGLHSTLENSPYFPCAVNAMVVKYSPMTMKLMAVIKAEILMAVIQAKTTAKETASLETLPRSMLQFRNLSNSTIRMMTVSLT